VSNSGATSDWPRLLRIASSLIRQVNATGPVIDRWTLGGGTALMLRIDHRESRDIDIFLDDPQQLAFLDPAKRDFRLETHPSGHFGDAARFLKLAFSGLGEIDFMATPSLTASPATQTFVEGETIFLESVPEILTKKIHCRSAGLKPRDVFDIAASAESHADAIIREFQMYRFEVAQAASALERLNPEFVTRTIGQLAITPRYECLVASAIDRAMELLRSV
jgi:Nucleotidyl transferase AbiEii toxin, Type IV TA system